MPKTTRTVAAIVPGLCLAVLYLLFVGTYAAVRPEVAPPLPPDLLNVPRKEYPAMIFKSFLPPVVLIGMIKVWSFSIRTPSRTIRRWRIRQHFQSVSKKSG